MALTSAQQTALKDYITTDPDGLGLAAFPNNSDGAFAIAAILNQQASPDFTVWRTDIPTSDVKKAIVWTEYIASTSAAERDALNIIIANGIVNGADANIRQAFLDIFSGPQKATTRAALTELAKRLATRAEKLFATGTGSNGSPATMGFEGSLSFQDVDTARNS